MIKLTSLKDKFFLSGVSFKRNCKKMADSSRLIEKKQ